MDVHVAVVGQMRECRETAELHRPGKHLRFTALGEPMINVSSETKCI